MTSTDPYISLDEAIQETGLNKNALLRMSLNNHISFYHHLSLDWHKVPFFVVEALYNGKDTIETPCLVEYKGAWRKTIFEGISPGEINTITRSWKFSLSSLHIHQDDIKLIKNAFCTERSEIVTTPTDTSLLKFVGALIEIHYLDKNHHKYLKTGNKPNIKAIADQFFQDLAKAGLDDTGIKESTVRKKIIPEAIESIQSNKNNPANS